MNSVSQALERVRSDVPRYLWARQYSSKRIGNGTTNPVSLMHSEDEKARANIQMLTAAGTDEDSLDLELDECFLQAWAEYASLVNVGMPNYRANIEAKLKSEGM